jgi:uncharacterized protein YndB with AHSA1/START domain
MDQRVSEQATQNHTSVERTSDRELVITRTFDAPISLVFEAWTRPELFMKWWAPRSMGVPLRACDMDVRNGGKYRLEFGQDEANTFAFFGRYLEVLPNARLVWTNDEDETGGAITTVTFEDRDGKTLLMFHDLYPTKEALDNAIAGMPDIMPEQFAQLDELLASLGRG